MGSAHQLTPAVSGTAAGTVKGTVKGTASRRGKSVKRTVLYGAGTLSMLLISMVSSLSLWIVLPWVFLDWSPTLVSSGSMQPLVAPGDVVMIRPAAVEELTPNTVILFDRDDETRVLHRIVEQMPDGTYRTQGDANAVPDSEFVRLDQVQGSAVLAVPWVGRPSLWLSEGRTVHVAATAVAAAAVLALAPRSFDPAYDPWASGRRVSPAEVLLGRSAGSRGDRRAAAGPRLLPEALHGLVLERLTAQSVAAQRRTAHLLEGLS